MLWIGDIVLVIGIFLLTAYVDLTISMQGKHDMGTSVFLVSGSVALCTGVVLIGLRNIQQIQRDRKQEKRDIEQVDRDKRIDALIEAVNTLISEIRQDRDEQRGGLYHKVSGVRPRDAGKRTGRR